jgi:hypothetical protein
VTEPVLIKVAVIGATPTDEVHVALENLFAHPTEPDTFIFVRSIDDFRVQELELWNKPQTNKVPPWARFTAPGRSRHKKGKR